MINTKSKIGIAACAMLLLTSAGGLAQVSGPDIFVSDLFDTRNWGEVGDLVAYSVATESCNNGDEDAIWVANTNEHPVIAQNLYRLKDGSFQQIGQSWLKHGFFAVNADDCGLDCDPPGGFGGDALGPGCSDPYDTGLNGSQTGLGPRFEVNATTGVFEYPFTFQDQTGDRVYKRLQVLQDDVRPSNNPGASYFVEGHYITSDDAQAGNGLNNASYREVTLDNGLRMDFAAPTRIGRPAVFAWQELDPEVKISEVDVANDGRFTVASRATDLGDGTWRYDYAVHNLNSHRSAQSFSVPIPEGVTVSKPTFHDVDYHSGEPWQGTDWAVTLPGGSDAVSWTTDSFGSNPEANALRWGTMYSFRFTADTPPGDASATVGMFRTGSPSEVMAGVVAPVTDLSCGGEFELTLTQGPLVRGESVTLTAAGALSGETVRFIGGTARGCGFCPDVLGGLCLEVLQPIRILGTAVADGLGTAELTITLPEGLAFDELVTQAVVQRGNGGEDSSKSNEVVDEVVDQ